MNLGTIFSLSTLLNTVNTSTIVILAALGCLMTDQAGIMCIGIDGMIIIGAFAGAMGSWLCGSWVMGLVFALAAGLLSGLFYGVLVIRYHSDEFIIGVAFNLFAQALTTFLLRTLIGQSGSFHPTTGEVVKIPVLQLGRVGDTQVQISIMVLLAWFLVLAMWVFLYKTPQGFWLHASGEHPESLRSVGRSPEKQRYFASLGCGLLCTLAGAYLSMGYLSTFTENMSASKGYVAVACVIFGRSNPLIVFFATLLFGFIEAAGLRMQGFIDPTLTATFPYVGTILMMVFLALRQRTRRGHRAAK